MSTDVPAPRMKTQAYEKELGKLQWSFATSRMVKANKLGSSSCSRAGCRRQGRHIKAIAERSVPRVFRVPPCPRRPSREDPAIPAALHAAFFRLSEIVIFDRSWYNRPGGICDGFPVRRPSTNDSSRSVPDGKIYHRRGHHPDQALARVGMDEQERRFKARLTIRWRQWN